MLGIRCWSGPTPVVIVAAHTGRDRRERGDAVVDVARPRADPLQRRRAAGGDRALEHLRLQRVDHDEHQLLGCSGASSPPRPNAHRRIRRPAYFCSSAPAAGDQQPQQQRQHDQPDRRRDDRQHRGSSAAPSASSGSAAAASASSRARTRANRARWPRSRPRRRRRRRSARARRRSAAGPASRRRTARRAPRDHASSQAAIGPRPGLSRAQTRSMTTSTTPPTTITSRNQALCRKE